MNRNHFCVFGASLLGMLVVTAACSDTDDQALDSNESGDRDDESDTGADRNELDGSGPDGSKPDGSKLDGSEPDSSKAGDAADGGIDSGSVGITGLPPRPAGTPTTTTRTFAVDSVEFGEAGAYKSLGYNLDGKISTAASIDVCNFKPAAGATAKIDGTNGVDNMFGNKVMSYVSAINPNPSKRLTDAYKAGDTTLIFSITGLSDSATQSATGLTAAFYLGGDFDPSGKKKPTFTSSDNWPVRTSLTPSSTFKDAYVNNGVWVSNVGELEIAITAEPVTILRIHHAVVTFEHSAPSVAAKGVIAGVVKTTELATELAKNGGSLSPAFCPGEANALALGGTVENASDMYADGTNFAGADCNAISVGIGFTAKEIGAPTRVAPKPAAVDPCD